MTLIWVLSCIFGHVFGWIPVLSLGSPEYQNYRCSLSILGCILARVLFLSLPVCSLDRAAQSRIHVANHILYHLGSCGFGFPLPYIGITLSLEMPALHTGQVCLFGLVSSHWCKQGQLETKKNMFNEFNPIIDEVNLSILFLVNVFDWYRYLLFSVDSKMRWVIDWPNRFHSYINVPVLNKKWKS